MDMRKLIDQTDFDNINELSKRWKKDPNHSSLADSRSQLASQSEKTTHHNEFCSLPLKENIHQQSKVDSSGVRESASQFRKGKRQVMPQVIDEDTQHFRNRLQHLLNGFKTDAVSEFMSMKKSMIEYQKDTIQTDTHKYLSMYQQKHKQLLEVKDQLIGSTSDVEKKSMQIELMSAHIAKLNRKIKTNQYLSRPFAKLYENKLEERAMRLKMNEATHYYNRHAKIKAYGGWRNFYREIRKGKEHQINDHRVEIEVKDIVARFQKQNDQLREKLAEATRKNEEHEDSKHMVQQNLKKAFLRGISSMNMEAMGIFGSNSELDNKSEAPQTHIKQKANTQYLNRSRDQVSDWNGQGGHSNHKVIVNKARVESKDHKWKEAPIMGFEQRQEIEQPRPHLVKPTTQAKVIRVVDGRSEVDRTGEKDKDRNRKVRGSQVGSKVEAPKRRI